jgi:ubiquinone/menaquinone biosynthesis C-methylase UbiE
VVRGGQEGRGLALTGLAAAYSAAGRSWAGGPARIYERLAQVLVSHAPASVVGGTVLDVGAGTGAAGRAAGVAGAARVVAVDVALGMLTHDPVGSSPAVVGDALALPFAPSAFDASVAAFVVNHLTDPVAGLAELRRVTRLGGAVLASVYAADDSHPVKTAVEDAFEAHGWTPDPWYTQLREDVLPLLLTADGCAAAMRSAHLEPHVEKVQVPFPELDAHALVDWRVGLAQHAPFFHRQSPLARQAILDEAVARLGQHPQPLVRSILVMTAIRR